MHPLNIVDNEAILKVNRFAK